MATRIIYDLQQMWKEDSEFCRYMKSILNTITKDSLNIKFEY